MGVQLLHVCAGRSTLLPMNLLITNALASGIPLAFTIAVQVPGRGFDIPVAKITGQGLTSIAILVALLWTCVIGERVLLARTNAGAAQVGRAMRELRLKNRRAPAVSPARPAHPGFHAQVG